MKQLSYNTLGRILLDLEEAGLKIPRATFYNLEERGSIPLFNRRTSGNWRVFTNDEMKKIKESIWNNYKGTRYMGK